MRYLVAASLLAAGLGLSGAARAEPLPLPQADFAMEARFLDAGTLSMRHAGGKLRTEVKVSGKTMTVWADLARKKAIVAVPVPGLSVAAEIDLAEDPRLGPLTGEGTRLGTATVAGETCTLWRVAAKAAPGGTATACITADGITLRIETSSEGKPRTVFEATELKRSPQDPAALTVPPDLSVIKLKGLKDLPLPGLGKP